MKGGERAELRALLRKYETIVRLRDERFRSGTCAPREVLRELAREFPGALRELQRTPAEELRLRIAALSEAVLGTRPVEVWMTEMVEKHRALRERIAEAIRAAARRR